MWTEISVSGQVVRPQGVPITKTLSTVETTDGFNFEMRVHVFPDLTPLLSSPSAHLTDTLRDMCRPMKKHLRDEDGLLADGTRLTMTVFVFVEVRQ